MTNPRFVVADNGGTVAIIDAEQNKMAAFFCRPRKPGADKAMAAVCAKALNEHLEQWRQAHAARTSD